MSVATLRNFLSKPVVSKLLRPREEFTVLASMCLHRFIDADAAQSMMQLLACPSPKFRFATHRGDALIDRARSIMATKFLNSNEDAMLFLDDDIIYDPLDAAKLCLHIKNGYDIAGGAYVLKRDRNSFITAKPLTSEPIVFHKDSPLVEVRYVATGFMAISRRVLEETAKTLPLCHPNSLPLYPFFQPFPGEVPGIGQVYLSEDWAFCSRARSLGFKVWLDPSIRLGHAGRYVYELEDLSRLPKQKSDTVRYIDPFTGSSQEPRAS